MFSFIFNKTEHDDFKEMLSSLKGCNERFKLRSKYAKGIGDSIFNLIQSEAPYYSVYFVKIKEIYYNLANVYEVASSELTRAYEDLNDIKIRYPILQRYEKEREELKMKYDEINLMYKDAKKIMKIQETQFTVNNFRNFRNQRAQAAILYVEKSEEFLNYQKRYETFVERRSRESWKRYGTAMKNVGNKEKEIMKKLNNLFTTMRDNVQNPENIIESIEQKQDLLNFLTTDVIHNEKDNDELIEISDIDFEKIDNI